MSRRFTLIPLLLTLVATPAFAGQLLLRGTPGATLRIDGDVVGFLPLDVPLELEAGPHDLKLSLNGYRSYRSEIVMTEDGLREMDISLSPLQPRTAAAASMVLAGLGQVYSGRSKTGLVFLGLQLATATTAVMLESEFKNRRDDYQRAHLAYSEAIDPEEIAALRVEVERRWNRLDELKPVRDGFVYSVFAIALVSAVEAWWHFPDVEVAADPVDGGLQIGLGGSF